MAAVSPVKVDWVFTEELRGGRTGDIQPPDVSRGRLPQDVCHRGQGHGDPVGNPALQLR
jgi:hypothetical protein